ncbi:MAG: U32 family peptidase [Canidatus Methanoxibalbensis ujae]|nr:U32 family peptidase [Candidatus Methanoxibalbensis ujae]
MRLMIPHPGHFDALKEILHVVENENLKDVHEVFMSGPPEIMGSGRAALHAALISEIKEQTAFAHQYDIRMNIIVNPSCLGGYHLTYAGYNMLRWYFNELNRAEVDAVTVAEPYLVEMLREYPMEIVVSCVSHVDSPQKAVFYEMLGADAITVDTNINRDFDVLRAIKRVSHCRIRVIVNEGCIYKCPFRYAHFNLFSHVTASRSPLAEGRPDIFSDYYFDRCISLRVRDPSQIIKSPWIRPEDLNHYEEIGIEDFKIAGRANTVAWILNAVRAYASREYDGNLIEILDCPAELKYIFYVDNNALEGCMEKWKKCNKMCNECGYCADITKKVLKLIEK